MGHAHRLDNRAEILRSNKVMGRERCLRKTAAFAVSSIRQWWLNVGQARYTDATRLLITADGGGSNGSRVRLWKVELQKLADELSLTLANFEQAHRPRGMWNIGSFSTIS